MAVRPQERATIRPKLSHAKPVAKGLLRRGKWLETVPIQGLSSGWRDMELLGKERQW
jgi:hypothetical protein